MSVEDDIRKGIQEELRENAPASDNPSEQSSYHDLASDDPDALWQRAKAHKRHTSTQYHDKQGLKQRLWTWLEVEKGSSWELVLRLFIWFQMIVGGLVIFFTLYPLERYQPGVLSRLARLPFILISVSLGILVFWLPTLYAHKKDRTYKWAITGLNLLAGGTFVGWVIALVWALMEETQNTLKDKVKSTVKNTSSFIQDLKNEWEDGKKK